MNVTDCLLIRIQNENGIVKFKLTLFLSPTYYFREIFFIFI